MKQPVRTQPGEPVLEQAVKPAPPKPQVSMIKFEGGFLLAFVPAKGTIEEQVVGNFEDAVREMRNFFERMEAEEKNPLIG